MCSETLELMEKWHDGCCVCGCREIERIRLEQNCTMGEVHRVTCTLGYGEQNTAGRKDLESNAPDFAASALQPAGMQAARTRRQPGRDGCCVWDATDECCRDGCMTRRMLRPGRN
jgi:hypothetical protein